MAIPTAADDASNSGGAQVELKDVFIDTQYAVPSTTPDQYTKEPWKYCQNPTKAFLSLRIKDRREFFTRLKPEQQGHIKHELQSIASVRQQFSSSSYKKGLITELEASKEEWKREVARSAGDIIQLAEKELHEVQYKKAEDLLCDPVFFSAFSGEVTQPRSSNLPLPDFDATLDEVAPNGLPSVIHKYRKFIAHWQRLKGWDTGTTATDGGPIPRRTSRGGFLFRSMNPIKRQTGQSPAEPAASSQQSAQFETIDESADMEDILPAVEDAEPEPLYGLKACAMHFKKAKGTDTWVGYNSKHPSYTSKFPSQKISMHAILNEPDGNPLAEACPPDEIRYFHFPTNNMSWIETAIARYYSEEPRPIDDRQPYDHKAKKTEKLLAREFWRGQMHGSGGASKARDREKDKGTRIKRDWTKRGGPVHARHMRSRCSIIPRDPDPGNQKKPSSTPPSPGLPWGLKGTGSFPLQPPNPEKNIALFLPYLHWETSSRRAKMVQVINQEIGYQKPEPRLNEILESLEKLEKKKKREKAPAKAEKPVQKAIKPPKYKKLLGKYLLAVARVADQMDYEADERLLRDHVKADPPLHIRRTLDQYYFATLDDTSQRKDQVVYRGTKGGRSLHSHDTRVVMVDQLWLWILDDNTIITSFPRRWGRNKPDPSGVYKSLRERLETRREEIKSIHHLALIIIDQCSRVFFDRTKPLDQRPEVMDLFAAAIGHVTEMTAVAYDSFWRHSHLHAGNMLPLNTKNRYLDINPEGVLLKEAQDITEELKIMKNIYTEQLNVVKDFKRHLHYPLGKAPKHGEAAVFMKLLLELTASQVAAAAPSSNKSVVVFDDEEERMKAKAWEGTLLEAEGILELIESRQAEIQDLEDSALRTCQQLQGLLSLKQQQASIVEAKAALQRADESVRQGRAIMAFTIVTIFFVTTLGFFATFFGMNNSDINDAPWMTLKEQIGYMFGLSAIVITMSISYALSPLIRTVAKIAVKIPYHILDEHTQIDTKWQEGPMNHVKLEQITNRWLEKRKKHRPGSRNQSPGENQDVAGASYSTGSDSSSESSQDPGGADPTSERPDAPWWQNGVSILRRGKKRTRGMV